jgi:hypothetical protein
VRSGHFPAEKVENCPFFPLTKLGAVPIFSQTINLENIMIQISDSARAELEAFFADKPKSGIRIYLAPGG